MRGICRACESELAAERARSRGKYDKVPKWCAGFLLCRLSRRIGNTIIEPVDIKAILELQDNRCYLTGVDLLVPPSNHNGMNWGTWYKSFSDAVRPRVVEPVKLDNAQAWKPGNIALVCRGVARMCNVGDGAGWLRMHMHTSREVVEPTRERVNAMKSAYRKELREAYTKSLAKKRRMKQGKQKKKEEAKHENSTHS